jgi:hypothetical protein
MSSSQFIKIIYLADIYIPASSEKFILTTKRRLILMSLISTALLSINM